MRKTIVVLAALLVCTLIAAEPEKRSEQELVDLYKAAYEAKDIDKLMSLYCMDGTAKDFLEADKNIRCKGLEGRIVDAKVESMPENLKERLMQGMPWGAKTIVPNLEPLKNLTLTIEVSPSQRYSTRIPIPIGKKGDVYYFVYWRFKGE